MYFIFLVSILYFWYCILKFLIKLWPITSGLACRLRAHPICLPALFFLYFEGLIPPPHLCYWRQKKKYRNAWGTIWKAFEKAAFVVWLVINMDIASHLELTLERLPMTWLLLQWNCLFLEWFVESKREHVNFLSTERGRGAVQSVHGLDCMSS